MKADIYDVFVRRVLQAIGNEKKTKGEIAITYKRLYPPTFREKFLQPERDDEFLVKIDSAVTFLVQEGYIKAEIISFTDRALKVPLVKYALTQVGLQEVLKLKTKEKIESRKRN
jgi:hypothetical protein